jgi:peptidoglycan/xylan/chitin deacetylase (PgdA/CDA1 family)
MLSRCCSLAVLAAALCQSAAIAAPCAKTNALGVSRVLTVDARRTPAVGSQDYRGSLMLAPREVVLTFDDGPRPPYTNRVLKALADECLRATFFMLGRQANANPEMARRVLAAGHTVGTHTQNHPMHRMSPVRAVAEINTGIDSVGNALGSPRALAPFFRFPGLYRTSAAEQYLRKRGLMAWSIDIDSYDYRHSSVSFMLQRMLANLERRQGGILLMHDIQPKTAAVLPTLLAELKRRGFRIVHVVPAEQGIEPELVARSRASADVEIVSAVPVKHHRRRVRQSVEPVYQQTGFDAAFTAPLR